MVSSRIYQFNYTSNVNKIISLGTYCNFSLKDISKLVLIIFYTLYIKSKLWKMIKKNMKLKKLLKNGLMIA